MDYTWGEKYREMNELKDQEFSKMKKDLQEQIDKDRRAHSEKVKELMTEFK